MSGLFEITVLEARGFVATTADIDRLAVVIGCTSLGSGLSPFFLSGESAVANVGYGDAVDTLTQVIEQKQDSGAGTKYPAAIYTTPAGTNGSYGTIDVTGVTGTAVAAVDSAVHPYGTYEAYIRITKSGFVGTSGIEFVWALDNGRNVSRTTALGTSTSFTIPNSNVKFDFSPSTADLTALNTLLNELKTDYEAHRVLTAGGVHGIADATNTITAANASSTATRIALANDLRAKINAHRILTAGGVHGAADTTNVITAPVATDDSTALILALQIKTKYNAHIVLTAGGVHGAADSTNGTTAPDPVAGAFAVGDVVKVRTFAPVPATADVDAAFTAIANSTIDCGLVICEFPCDAAMALHVTSGLNTLLAMGKRVTALVRTRIPTFESSETDAAWNTSIAADWFGFTDSRIVKCAAYGLITDAVTVRQYKRSFFAQMAADVVRIPRKSIPNTPADQKMANCTLVDSTGATIGHDEGPRGSSTGLSNESLGNTFWTVQRLPDSARREDVYCTIPWVCFAADERIRVMNVRRLANAMERDAVSAGNSALGQDLFFIPGPSPRLTPASTAALQGKIFFALKRDFLGEIANADDAALNTGLVQVNPAITITGGNLLHVSVTIAPIVGGIVLTLTITLAVQQ